MPDRHMPVSRRFDLSKGVPRAWPLAWVPHTSSGITAKRTVKVSWGQRVLSVVMVGATLVTGLATLAVTPPLLPQARLLPRSPHTSPIPVPA